MRINTETHFAIVVIENFLGSPSDWVKLTSLTWNVTLPTDLSDSETPGHIIAVLKHFRPPNVRDVAVVFPFSSFGDFLWFASQPSASKLCAELEDGLMTTPQPTVSFSSGLPINSLHRRYIRLRSSFQRWQNTTY